MLILAERGLGQEIIEADVEGWLRDWQLSYVADFNAIEVNTQRVIDLCDSVHIPTPLNLTAMYPSLPLYTSEMEMIERSSGSPTPDQLVSCPQRLAEIVPDVCPDIMTITPAVSSRWICSRQCASQLPDALTYCETSVVKTFLVPLASRYLHMLNEKVEEWEVYALLGAATVGEPGMAPNANLQAQDVPGWFEQWQSEYFRQQNDADGMLVEMRSSCE
eukprot:SAG31_NODE_8837_length_1377_cov_2.387534_3_plen_217_part_01